MRGMVSAAWTAAAPADREAIAVAAPSPKCRRDKEEFNAKVSAGVVGMAAGKESRSHLGPRCGLASPPCGNRSNAKHGVDRACVPMSVGFDTTHLIESPRPFHDS